MRAEFFQSHHPGREFESGAHIHHTHDRMVEGDRCRRCLGLGNQRRHGYIDQDSRR